MSCMTLPLTCSVQIWTKTTSRNNAGQPVREWSYKETVSCEFAPARAEERLVGRIQNPIAYVVTLSPHTDIDEEYQLRDITTTDGTLVEEGPFNVVGIRKHMGFRSLSHFTVMAQKVLD